MNRESERRIKDRKRERQKGEKAVKRIGEDIRERVGEGGRVQTDQGMEGSTPRDRSCYRSGGKQTDTHLHTQTHKGHSAPAALQTHSCRDTDILVNNPRKTPL